MLKIVIRLISKLVRRILQTKGTQNQNGKSCIVSKDPLQRAISGHPPDKATQKADGCLDSKYDNSVQASLKSSVHDDTAASSTVKPSSAASKGSLKDPPQVASFFKCFLLHHRKTQTDRSTTMRIMLDKVFSSKTQQEALLQHSEYTSILLTITQFLSFEV